MNTPQVNRYRTSDQSAKEALRTHIEQLTFEMQREFVEVALQLIAARPLPQLVPVTNTPHMAMRRSRWVH